MTGVLAVAAAVPLAMPTSFARATTGCEPVPNVPRYNDYTHYAEAGAWLPCGGTYTLKLMTSSGTTLASMSGIAVSTGLQTYTNWTYCPSGTSVRSWVTDKVTIQGNTYSATATSAYFLCP